MDVRVSVCDRLTAWLAGRRAETSAKLDVDTGKSSVGRGSAPRVRALFSFGRCIRRLTRTTRAAARPAIMNLGALFSDCRDCRV
jgi:hypothetical protein